MGKELYFTGKGGQFNSNQYGCREPTASNLCPMLKVKYNGETECVACPNGQKFNESTKTCTTTNGVTIPNCKYVSNTGGCSVCEIGYYWNKVYCAKSSVYIGQLTSDAPNYATNCNYYLGFTATDYSYTKGVTCTYPSGFTNHSAPAQVKNFCDPKKCAQCTRVGDHFSC
jgi:hypothetical protein